MDYAFSSPEITELSKALIEVQKQLQPAIKDAENPFVKNRYATLNSVMDSCRMALLENGILLTQYPVPVEGANLGLVTKLVHAKTGQFQASLAVIPLAKPDPQAMGSAFTYGRRYALSAMLGIVSEEDDDGNAASGRKTKGPVRGVKDAGVKPGPTVDKKAAPVDRVPLSQLLADLGLAELMPCYRAYLRKEYGCSTDKITVEQYEEQKAMLETCKQEPLKLRNLMRTLHGFK